MIIALLWFSLLIWLGAFLCDKLDKPKRRKRPIVTEQAHDDLRTIRHRQEVAAFVKNYTSESKTIHGKKEIVKGWYVR